MLSRKEYYKYIRVIKHYLAMDGYKTKILKHTQSSHVCQKCQSTNPAEKLAIIYPFTDRALFFYVSKCESCKTAFLYKTLEVIEDDNNSELQING